MVKKESNTNLEPTEVIEASGSIVSDDQFDLTVLKMDIENAEKEAKAVINQNIIDQANIQQETEILQVETENIQTVNEALKELLEFGFSFFNKKLEKIDVSKFDSKFVDELLEKLMKLIPKDRAKDFQRVIGLTDKTSTAVQMLKIGKFIMFLSQELYQRYDEYMVYRKINDMPKLNFSLPKKDKTEA